MRPSNLLLHAALNWVAPTRCTGCDLHHKGRELGVGGAGAVTAFCAACAPLVELAPEGLWPAASRRAAAAYAYGGPIADAIARLKYAQRTEFAPALGQLLAQAGRPYAECAQRVIPLPLHPRKLRERGYNQSALLAAWVARGLGLPLDTRTLSRVRDTQPQAGLDRAERPANVRGAFRVRAPGPRLFAQTPRDEREAVLLVDDVRTTGATLAAAADALCASGYPAVFTLALAAASG